MNGNQENKPENNKPMNSKDKLNKEDNKNKCKVKCTDKFLIKMKKKFKNLNDFKLYYDFYIIFIYFHIIYTKNLYFISSISCNYCIFFLLL